MPWTHERDAAPASPAAAWPRTYRPGVGTRVLVYACGAALAVGGLALLGWAAWGDAGASRVALIAAGGFVVLLGAGAILALRSVRVVLREDAIEFFELGRRRRFQKGELVGRRVIPLQYGQRQLVLELRMGRRPFKTGWLWKEDEAFTAWLAALPDLDAEERARAEAELLRSKELGASEAERAASLRRARRTARAATAVSVGACAWGFLRPRPYGLALGALAAIPVLVACVLLLGRGAYSVEGKRNDPRPDLGLALAAPGVVLMLRSILDLQLIDWRPPLLWTVLAAPVAVVLVLRAADPGARRRWYVVPLLALLAGPWAWGMLTLGNAVLDRGRGESFQARVVDKRIASGKHTSYYLRLAPWGPVADEDEIDVGRKAYQRIDVGDVVCPRLRPGALGFRWFRLERCEGP